jgi:hypothetical protein
LSARNVGVGNEFKSFLVRAESETAARIMVLRRLDAEYPRYTPSNRNEFLECSCVEVAPEGDPQILLASREPRTRLSKEQKETG